MEKLLPQNIEAEQGVLGSIMLDPEALPLVADFLTPEAFYRDGNRTIYQAMLTLYANREPADIVTLCDALAASGKLEDVGGSNYIASLVNAVPTSGNIEYYGRIVEGKATYRRLIHVAGGMAADAYAEDPESLLKAEEAIYRVREGRRETHVSSVSDALSRYMSKLDQLHEGNRNQAILGIPTGFCALDDLLAPGLQKADLVTLAGRPGNGKTSMALNIARHAMHAGFRVLFFSLEMSEEQMIRRLVSMETHIDQTALRSGDISDSEWDAITDGVNSITAAGKLWIDDSSSSSAMEIRSRARRVQAEHGLDLVIVDHLLLVKPGVTGNKQETRAQQVSQIAHDLKGIARDLDIPVLALAQMSRASEQRANKEPQLSDLKESGGIEEHSDIVAFLYSDESQVANKMKANPYIVKVIVEKHRNGPVGLVPLTFIPRLTQFRDLEASA